MTALQLSTDSTEIKPSLQHWISQSIFIKFKNKGRFWSLLVVRIPKLTLIFQFMKNWLGYSRLKTINTISKRDCSSTFYWLLGNWALSSTLNISVNHLHVSTQFLRSEFLSSSGPGPGLVMVQSWSNHCQDRVNVKSKKHLQINLKIFHSLKKKSKDQSWR